MKRKCLALALVCALLGLCGCQLARPEAENGEDRFCGFYVVPYHWLSGGQLSGEDFYENPNLTVYGTETVRAGGYGTFRMDREVLFAEKGPNGQDLIFPGMSEGYSLFCYNYMENGNPISAMQSNMAPDKEGTQLKVTDEGETWSFGGTVYYGPPADAPENWKEQQSNIVWRAYRVWETADGRVYLDGSGNSYGGGGGMSFWEDHTYTWSESGKATKTDTVSAKVSIETVPRLERLTVYQYGADSALLSTIELTPEEELLPLKCLPGTAWVVVEEMNAGGAVHTAYDLTDESVFHGLVLLDDEGMGTYVQLEITR